MGEDAACLAADGSEEVDGRSDEDEGDGRSDVDEVDGRSDEVFELFNAANCFSASKLRFFTFLLLFIESEESSEFLPSSSEDFLKKECIFSWLEYVSTFSFLMSDGCILEIC